MKKLTSIILILALLCPIFADLQASDIKNHWAETYISKWYNQGLISGYPDGSFRPDTSITRAEFLSMLNNLYGYNYKNSQYADVKTSDWYYETCQIAKSNNYMSWYDSIYLNANKAITREEVCAILYHVIYLENHDDGVLLSFTDEFNDWSKSYIAALVEAGYLSGYPDGSFKPEAQITRAECLVMLNQVMGQLINQSGSYDHLIIPSNLTVSQAGVRISDSQIKGDLILGPGIDQGEVFLDNVKVYGRTIVSGGGQSSINITNSSLGQMIIDVKGHSVHVKLTDTIYDDIKQYSDTSYTGNFDQTIYVLNGKTNLREN